MLEEYDISTLQDHFATGEWSSAGLCRQLLERIGEIDRAGPTLRSVIEVNPDAPAIAESLDEERRRGRVRGPLHGVPVFVKDSIDTADAMMTTAGSLALVGNIAPRDAFLVTRLRDAGAVILGKTNMSEWGYMRSTRGCSGWSSRGGQVRNPYALDRSPSGSSSGSAVAVAANLCTAAIGAEVDGSIVRPASINGIVGLKPTVGLVSRSGIIGVAAPQDTAGPMTRTVADLATVLTVLAGEDSRDPATSGSDAHRPAEYRAFLDAEALRGARLGVARDLMGTHAGVDAVIDDAVRVLADLGAEVVDPANGTAVPLFGDAEMQLFLYELKGSLNRYLAEHPGAAVRTLEELIRFNWDRRDEVMPFFGQELLELAQAKGGLEEAEYHRAKAECVRLSRTDGIDKVMREHRLDALIAPTDGMPAWAIDPICGDRIAGGCSSPAAMAGYPHITVPAGYFHGLPVALSFFSDAHQEGRLIGYAYAFEQATKVRRPPTFVPTVDV
jgi:amidase